MVEKSRIDAEIKAAEKQLAVLDQKRAVLMETIQRLKNINRSVSSEQNGTLHLDASPWWAIDRCRASQKSLNLGHSVIVRKTDFVVPHSFDTENYTAIHKFYAALVDNQSRNQMIADDIMNATSNDRFPVVLTERKKHLEILKTLLENKVNNLIVMKGGMGKKQRRRTKETLENIKPYESSVILATGRYLGEGFDASRLDTLFLTMPISWKGTLSQYAGRLHRMHDMKNEVQIYDYADLNVPMLARMFDRRVRGYRSIGYQIGENKSKNSSL